MSSVQTLALIGGGGTIATSERGALRLVDAAGARPEIAIPLPEPHQVVAFDDEVWTVTGPAAELRRFDLRGTELGAPTPLPGRGRLVGAPTAAHGAVWTGAPVTALAPSPGGGVTTRPLATGSFDAIVPVSAAQWVTVWQDRVVLRDAVAERWTARLLEPGATVASSAVVFDGRAVVLHVAGGGDGGATLLVVDLRDGSLQHRITLTGVTTIRFAPRRGLGVLVTEDQRVLAIDLRFGRVIQERPADDDAPPIEDLALDPTAQLAVVRVGGAAPGVRRTSVRDLLAGGAALAAEAPPTVPVPPARAAALPEPVRRAAAPDPTTAAADFHRGHPVLGPSRCLAPRVPAELATAGENATLLARYHDVARNLTGRAIARAWHSGRLTYPNDGSFPFQSEVHGLLGRTTGRASDEVETASTDADAALSALQAFEHGIQPRRTILNVLGQELGVSPLGRVLLLLIAGPALWGDLARLYGILANDEHRALVDEHLLGQILAEQVDALEIARELDREQPLLRNGLVHVTGSRPRPFSSLSVDTALLRLIRGAPIEGDLDDQLREHPSTRTFEELRMPAAVKARLVADLAAAGDAPARIVVRGRSGSGRHTLLAALAEVARRRLAVIDASALPRDPRAGIDRLHGALLRAHMLGMLPCVDGLEAIGTEDHAVRDLVREVIRRHPGPVAVRLPREAPAPLDPGFIAVDLPPLSVPQRVRCWTLSLAAHGLALPDPGVLARRYAVGPGVIERVCDQVARAPAGDGAAATLVDRLDAAVRQHLESRLGTVATRVARLASWSQVVLPPDIQDSILELIARIKHRGTVFDSWGFDAVMTTSRGVTALLQGGPGTGKTMVASAIAHELGMDLYRVDLSRIMSKWIGETEQNLAKLFDAAEDGHAIILFDEADSLFAKRTEVRTSVDRYANLEVNYLLQRLDSFDGIAILTTNFGTSIDAAFKRRLSFRLTFPFPDEDTREQLWRVHIPSEVPTAGDFDLPELARRYRLSGGYIRNAVLRAAFLAAEEQVPLSQHHLERAVRAEFREIGKLADSGVLE